MNQKEKLLHSKLSLLLKCVRTTKADPGQSWHQVYFGEVGGVCSVFMMENKEAGSKSTKSDGRTQHCSTLSTQCSGKGTEFPVYLPNIHFCHCFPQLTESFPGTVFSLARINVRPYSVTGTDLPFSFSKINEQRLPVVWEITSGLLV